MSTGPEWVLATPRIGFRCWRHDDLPLAMELWGDERVTRFLGFGGPLSLGQVRVRLESEIATQRDHGFQYWPIFLLHDGSHVGCCGLRPYCPADRIHELGFHLRPDFWGQGLAVEASKAVIHHAFTALAAEALFAGHFPQNDSSRRVLLKLGFQDDGMKVYPVTGILEPTYLLRNPAGRRSTGTSD